MPVSELVMVCLMAFVLLAPTLMVAVLISGVSRRSPLGAAPLAVDADLPDTPAPVAAPVAAVVAHSRAA